MIDAPMNDKIRHAIKVELARRSMTQTDLANALGISKQHVNRALSGDLGKVPPIWARILDHLGLELTVRSKAGRLEEE